MHRGAVALKIPLQQAQNNQADLRRAAGKIAPTEARTQQRATTYRLYIQLEQKAPAKKAAEPKKP